VLDHSWVDPSFALRAGHTPDVSFTYDGCLIVSDQFRAAINDFAGASFVPLPSQPGWSLLLAGPQVTFDSDRRKTRFTEFCEECRRFTSVAGATPVFLVDPVIPLPDEVMRTDVEFGTGDELHALVLVGPGVADRLRREHLAGLDLAPIEH